MNFHDFSLKIGGVRKRFFRVGGYATKKKYFVPLKLGGSIFNFFQNWACEILRTRYVCSGM